MNTESPSRPAHRRTGWEKCFAAAWKRAEGRAFDWGRFDCCLWAADAVLAITGVDLAAGLRGTYCTREDAQRLVADRGGLEKLIADLCREGGLEECPPALAQRGDVVLLPGRDGFPAAAAICVGAHAAAPGPTGGLALQPMALATAAWRIPHAHQCRKSSQQ